jgi:microcystin-dependent protein
MTRKASAFLVAASVWLSACPAMAQFAEQASWGGTAGGSAAAQTITLNNVLTLADILGVPIKFIPITNTGATTLTVNALAATPIQRPTPAGMAALGGAELIAGHVAIVVWNGTVFDLQNSARPEPPGAVVDYAGSSCPAGFTTANAATVSQTTQAPLYGVLASIWGSNAGGNFTLPDLRGRATFGQDSGGSGRITVAGGNCDGTIVGNSCGQQNQTLTLAQLPATPAPVSVSGQPTSNSLTAVSTDTSATGTNVVGGGSIPIFITNVFHAIAPLTSTTNTLNLGSGNAHPVLSNAAIVNKCVRF